MIELAPQNDGKAWVFLPDFWRGYGDTNRWQLDLNGNMLANTRLEAVAGLLVLSLSPAGTAS